MMHGMRTTVTLEPDTHRLVRRAMRVRGATFKDTVNEAIRRGLLETLPENRPFVVKSQPMGLRGHDPRELRKLDDDAEVERFLRVTRDLQEDGE